LLRLSAVIVVLHAGTTLSQAASFPPTSWLGGTGLWQTSTNWSNGTPTAFGTAFIDNGLTTVNSVVTLAGNGAARGLTIDLGDHLLIGDNTAGDNSTLTIEDLDNAGLISTGQGQLDTLTITGVLINTGTIAANNGSILVLNGANFANSNMINNGLIDIGKNPGDALADAEFNAANTTMSITGYLNSSGAMPSLLIDSAATLTFAGITGNGSVQALLGPVSLTLNTPAATKSAYSGSISGNVAVTKNGAGTQIFSGDNSASTGATDINAGTLQLDNFPFSSSTGGTGSGNLTVHAGGTLAGIGSTFSTAIVEDGGAIAPGDNGPGTLTIGLSLLLQPGSTLKMDIGNGPTASDLLRVADGEFDASAVNIQFIPHGQLTFHQSYTFLNFTGALTLDGPIDPSDFILLPSGVTGNFIVDNSANTVSFFVLADAGDANEDGKVDLSDLNIILNHLGTATTDWTDGNFDGAPTIDLTDLNDVLNTLGTSSIAPSAAAPEPTSLLLLLTATLPLLAAKRRRR
jgi:autotransporter-associated beta strand protein